MPLRVYNTLTGKKEEFVPLQPGKVSMYVCGVTVYDTCHVGHARSAINFDVIARYLRYRGFKVTFVKNFTDVDDKIIIKANKEGVGFREISERYIAEHNDDMDRLGIEQAEAAGFDPVKINMVPVKGVNDDEVVDFARLTLDRLAIGRLVERSVPALVVRHGQMKTNLLGMSFLDRLESWEVRSDRLMLHGYP